MSQEQCQQAARNETLVPSTDRVKICTSNMRIETNVPQREETFQVISDVIKAFPCYKAFTITIDVPEIYILGRRQAMTDYINQELLSCEAKLRRRKTMFYLRFTKIIINHFLLLNPSIPKGPSSGLNTIKDDGVINRLKFVRIGEYFQEYGLAIPKTMLTEEIRQLEAYQTFIKYSTSLIPLKKSRGKGSQGKKQAVTPKPASVKVSDEFDPEPAKRKIGSRRSRGVVIQDTLNVPKKKLVDHSQKLKGVQMLTAEEQLATYTMQAIKNSKKLSKSQPHAGGSIEGTGIHQSIDIEDTDDDEERTTSDDEYAKDEVQDDKYVHNDEHVHDEEDKEMNDAKVTETSKDDDDMTDAGKADIEKIEEVKGDNKKAELPPTSCSLSVSSGFGNQFLAYSSDISLTGTLKDTTDKTSTTTEVLVEEPDFEIASDDVEQTVDDLVNDTDQPQDDLELKIGNPLTFDEIMATSIDFSKFAMNRLKIDKLTKADLDDRCPFDLRKSLPLKGHPCHLTVAAEYFFYNDMEYIKSTNPEKRYTTSDTKTKAARYELVGIKDMVPKL
ncbi:hypothetical protein Tco_0103082 [Tanacetum coccineum]